MQEYQDVVPKKWAKTPFFLNLVLIMQFSCINFEFFAILLGWHIRQLHVWWWQIGSILISLFLKTRTLGFKNYSQTHLASRVEDCHLWLYREKETLSVANPTETKWWRTSSCTKGFYTYIFQWWESISELIS